MPAGIVRMNLNQRTQHGLLALAVAAALATGVLLGRPPGVGAAALRAWHLAAGLGALALVVFHLLYLAVRGYVESQGWGSFALRPREGDGAAALAEVRHVLGAAGSRPPADEYRVSQKALYWWTIAALALLGATGMGVAFWTGLGTLRLLPTLAAFHRGLAFLLLGSVLWHLYGALTWEGALWPEWSWVTGELDARKAQLKVPGAWRRAVEEAAAPPDTRASAAPEKAARERLAREKGEVEAELEKGNRCAHGEQYVEALYHYRRALELYPGYSQARYNMARVLTRMGEREMAREAYLQFLDADPFHPLAGKAQESIRELDASGGGP